jgi:enoyl-[acyl-carrier protein] reductase I
MDGLPTTVAAMSGLLDGKRIVVTGVLTDASIAFAVARLAQAEGAEIVLTGAGRGLSLTQRTARKLDGDVDVLELDVTVPDNLAAVRDTLASRWGRVDGVLHAIAFAPEDALGGRFLTTPPESAITAFQTSAYSFKALANAFADLYPEEGASVVGLDFDATVAWPAYDWMGVAKAALESTARYLARELGPQGIRVNLVAAGPVRTMAAKSIPGFAAFEDAWQQRAPLGWSISDAEPVARACVALLSDWFPATTGEMIHVDGGYHAIGA